MRYDVIRFNERCVSDILSFFIELKKIADIINNVQQLETFIAINQIISVSYPSDSQLTKIFIWNVKRSLKKSYEVMCIYESVDDWSLSCVKCHESTESRTQEPKEYKLKINAHWYTIQNCFNCFVHFHVMNMTSWLWIIIFFLRIRRYLLTSDTIDIFR